MCEVELRPKLTNQQKHLWLWSENQFFKGRRVETKCLFQYFVEIDLFTCRYSFSQLCHLMQKNSLKPKNRWHKFVYFHKNPAKMWFFLNFRLYLTVKLVQQVWLKYFSSYKESKWCAIAYVFILPISCCGKHGLYTVVFKKHLKTSSSFPVRLKL